MATGSKSARMTPLLGLAFLTSAIRRMGGAVESAARKSRGGGASASRRRNVDSGLPVLALAISSRFAATILSRIVGMGPRAKGGRLSAISYQLSAISYQLSAFSNSRCYILACVLVCCFAIGLFPLNRFINDASICLTSRTPATRGSCSSGGRKRSSCAKRRWYSSSLAEPAARSKNRAKSASVARPQPSAMLAGIETAARRVWEVSPYNSSRG